jgi:hypothetical protein
VLVSTFGTVPVLESLLNNNGADTEYELDDPISANASYNYPKQNLTNLENLSKI